VRNAPAPTKEKCDDSFNEELLQIVRVSSEGVGNDKMSACDIFGGKEKRIPGFGWDT